MSACVVALQIRDVSDDVRDTLAERARQQGQSLYRVREERERQLRGEGG